MSVKNVIIESLDEHARDVDDHFSTLFSAVYTKNTAPSNTAVPRKTSMAAHDHRAFSEASSIGR